MIPFFRKIRKKLFDEKKPIKYLKYAIGEIVLVVLGILIALQVNNWKEDHVLKQQEVILLQEIHSEYKYNKKQLEDILQYYESALNSIYSVSTYFPIDMATVNHDSLGIHLQKMGFNGDYDYSSVSIKKIDNAASYDIISNKTLKDLIYQLDIDIEDCKSSELILINHNTDQFQPLLDYNLPKPYGDGFKDPRVKLAFFETIAFQNLIVRRRRHLHNYLYKIKRHQILQKMNEIIKLSKPTE